MYLLQHARNVLCEGGFSNLIFRASDFLRSSAQAYQLYYDMLRHRQIYNALADPTKIVWVYPSEIQRSMSFSSRWELAGAIENGDWDTEHCDLEKNLKFQSIKQRYLGNKSWEETGIIDYISGKIKDNGSFDACRNRQDVVRRYEAMDELYESLKKSGYDMNKHVSNPKWYNPISIQAIDHPMISIGRDGELLLASGYHRVSMAQILDIKIPVWVLKRHTDWQLLREEIYEADCFEQLSPKAKDHLDHPDMQDVGALEFK